MASSQRVLSKKGKKDQSSMTAERRNTRSNKSLPSSLLEQADKTLTKDFDESKVEVEFDSTSKPDGKISIDNLLNIQINCNKDLDMVNMNPKVVLTPLYHNRKNAEKTCDFDRKIQRKRVNHKYWENKLTGACRISRRLKNMKPKSKDFDKRDSKKSKKRYPKIPSSKKLGQSMKMHVKRHMSPIKFLEPTKPLVTTINNSKNVETEKNFDAEDNDNPTTIVHSNNPLTHSEVGCVMSTNEDSIIVSQCPDDEVILLESSHDKESSHVLEDNKIVSATNIVMDGVDDLSCAICVESTMEILSSEELQEPVKLSSHNNVSDSPEKVCEDTEIKSDDSTKVQCDESSPTNEC